MSTARQGRESITLKGIGVSAGVVIGPAYVLALRRPQLYDRDITAEDVEHEICRLEEALIETRRQIKIIQKDLETRTGVRDASILDAHLMVLDDRTFIEEVIEGVRTQRRCVEAVLRDVSEGYAEALSALEDDYLRERVADVRDVALRIIRNLVGEQDGSSPGLDRKHIVVAEDLAPSETAALKRDMVIGFAIDAGSSTSHTAVMARALQIPAMVGLHDVTNRVSTGDEILMDGNKGILIVHPTAEQLEQYGRVAEARRTIERELDTLKLQPAETSDGHRIVLSANTEGPDEVDSVLEHGAEGVGLFRSEYLYLSRDAIVSEEEQAEAYSSVASRLAPAPVIIRTLDLGGDKYLPSSLRARETNPFLGCRSIRLSLLHPDPFKSQLRAILKASAKGNVKVMYPMISSVEEVKRANELLEESKDDLRREGVPFAENIEVGIMIEIPSAALTADALAEHVSFFSLGTNDLIQYTLAVDRVNDRVAYLYQPTHPAVLKLIDITVESGHRHGIWVGLCGEMAASPLFTPLLVGLGVDELSVAPTTVPLVKDAIRSVSYAQAKKLAQLALTCRSADEVMEHCRNLTRKTAPELLELV